MLQNTKITQVTSAVFSAQSAKFKSVHFDLGTGDGKFVYREALKKPDTFFVGVDCNPDLMRHMSWKVNRKPSRGGVDNVAFMVTPVSDLPPSIRSLAERITINYPWGSLLAELVVPEIATLSRISNLGKDGSRVDIALNYDVFSNLTYLAKLNLPPVDANYIERVLRPQYAQCSIHIQSYEVQSETASKSTWGQHLTLGSQRKVLSLNCIVKR